MINIHNTYKFPRNVISLLHIAVNLRHPALDEPEICVNRTQTDRPVTFHYFIYRQYSYKTDYCKNTRFVPFVFCIPTRRPTPHYVSKDDRAITRATTKTERGSEQQTKYFGLYMRFPDTGWSKLGAPFCYRNTSMFGKLLVRYVANVSTFDFIYIYIYIYIYTHTHTHTHTHI
jgi:hypothetical protein